MNERIVTWINSWDSKEYNIEIGFTNHASLRGNFFTDNYNSIDEFPNVDFFLQLNVLKPKLYEDAEIEYGCIYCFINDSKYEVIFYYKRGKYLVTDEQGTIIKLINTKQCNCDF